MTAQAFGRISFDALEREAERLAALQALDILDTPSDPGFDHIVQLMRVIFSVDIGIVSLIDGHRQWYKSCSGLSWTEVPRDGSFCKQVVIDDIGLVVEDASKDARFADHPAVTGDAHVRFYAGVPLKTNEGHVVGTVCAIDRKPRSFSQHDLEMLEGLATIAMDRIELLKSASTDGLTGLLNRRAFKAEAERAIALSLRHGHDLACIVLDIDHFKAVNDTYGHFAGDEVIKAVAVACRGVMRSEDSIGRLGGEELAVILPLVNAHGALAAAERLRLAIASTIVAGDFGEIAVTASIGVASLSIVARDIDTLLAEADTAMYRAKINGRNQCVAAEATETDEGQSSRRQVLKAGSVMFDDGRSMVDCTVTSLGSRSGSLMVTSTAGIPSQFILSIPVDNFEIDCRVVAQDAQKIQVEFR